MMRGVRRLRRFLTMPGADKYQLARAWLALAAVDVRLRTGSFQRLTRHIERRRAFHDMSIAEIEEAKRMARWLELASRHHVVGAHCLHRSLALHAALRRMGLESVLRIGVRKDGTLLRAHAWIELDGQVINDAEASTRDFIRLAQTGTFNGAGREAPAAPGVRSPTGSAVER